MYLHNVLTSFETSLIYIWTSELPVVQISCQKRMVKVHWQHGVWTNLELSEEKALGLSFLPQKVLEMNVIPHLTVIQ